MTVSSLRRLLVMSLVTLLVGLLATGIIGRAPAASAQIGVTIVDFAFRPAVIAVPVGTTVLWTNSGAQPHTVTSDTGVWDSGVLTTGGTFSFTFNQAGTFTYHCRIHPFMRGAVQVGVTTAVPTTTIAPTPIMTIPLFPQSACTTVGYRFDVDDRTAYSFSHPCGVVLLSLCPACPVVVSPSAFSGLSGPVFSGGFSY